MRTKRTRGRPYVADPNLSEVSKATTNPSAPARFEPPTCLDGLQPGLTSPTLDPHAGPIWQIRATAPARLPDGRLDARAHCARVLEHIRKLRREQPNRPCTVVFDLDNTLFDTRARTLYALQRFDETHGTRHFEGFGVDDVGWNGKETCGRLGLDAETSDAVHAAWEETFWAGESFAQDLVILPLFELAWAAKEAGAEVRYLTGRIDALADASVTQLVEAGLPDADRSHLFCKPDVETRTGPFKAQQLADWMADGAFVGWFATDNRREVEEVLGHRGGPSRAPVVHVEHALQRPGAIPLDVPTYPEDDLLRRARPAEARGLRGSLGA